MQWRNVRAEAGLPPGVRVGATSLGDWSWGCISLPIKQLPLTLTFSPGQVVFGVDPSAPKRLPDVSLEHRELSDPAWYESVHARMGVEEAKACARVAGARSKHY